MVLDRSGSMESIADDTIGGFNKFLDDQKAVPGQATISLVQFDDKYEVVMDGSAIASANRLDRKTFVPRGSTALLDAIGRTINKTGDRIGKMEEKDRPEKVLFVIITDGQENASREFTNEKINEMISHQRDIYQWQFVFLAANQDAISTASKMGIGANASMTYAANSAGSKAAFASLSANTASLRCCAGPADYSFAEEDRKTQRNAGAAH